jgi:hypothetical protein
MCISSICRSIWEENCIPLFFMERKNFLLLLKNISHEVPISLGKVRGGEIEGEGKEGNDRGKERGR